jgi:hypothetical protein
MKKVFRSLAIVPLLAAVSQAQRPWQQITVPSLREAAANFKAPPHEYGALQPFTSWNGSDPAEIRSRIVRDLDRMVANGLYMFNLSPGRGEPKYLTPAHMDQVKFTVQEAAKRGMRIWIQDESDYPSGFAGGFISKLYPQLGMQGLVADIRVHVVPGQTLTMPVPPDTLGIMALKTTPDTTLVGVIPIAVPENLQLKWITPNEGSTPNEPRYNWEVVFVRHVYVSSPTRNFNREDGTRAKDALYSLIDYLDPEATRAYLKITHETYRQAVGDQFGKVVMGFFGDEPDYTSSIPWTPKLLEEFQKVKGYDLKPYIPQFFTGGGTDASDETRRVRADYTDVWSGIFQYSFFKEQADWCKKYNVEYLVHLNHEETMMALVRSEGDFFRDLGKVGVPGIDNLSQLLPGVVHSPDGTWNINNNFPKLASSAAHLYARPQVWTEGAGGSGVDGKYQLDFQLVRGVNLLSMRVPVTRGGGDPSVTAPPPAVPPQAPMILAYANRAGYLMAIGRPAAQVGLYHPTNSMWMGDEDANRSTTKLGWQLFEHQVDWDYFDEGSLTSAATIEGGGFKNLSGQTYRAIVVPSSTVITRTGLARFQAFVKAGGKLIFVGKAPSLVLDRTFKDAKETPDLSFATLIEPSGDITDRVLAALPKPDVKLDAPFQRLTYTRRSLQDAELYFFFNESDKVESRVATIAGHGQAQVWDLGTGEIHPVASTAVGSDAVSLPLQFAPYEAKMIVVGSLPTGVAAAAPAGSAAPLADVAGDWTVDLNGKQLTTPLKSWEDLGTQSFAGPATYRKQFNAPAAPAGKKIYLEIADVRDYARIKLNGKLLEGRAWQPYCWDVTSALKTGANELEIEVQATAAGRGPGGPPPTAAAAAPAAAAAGGGRGGRGGRAGRAGAPAAEGAAAGGRGRAAAPVVSGLLGPVRLVAR